MEQDDTRWTKRPTAQEASDFPASPERSLSLSTKEEDSMASESIEVLQDEGVHEDELKVILGMLTRMGFRNQMWRNKFVGFNVIVGYLTTYATYARFCHFLDQYGMGFIIAFTTSMFFVGLPLVYLEMALGQFTTLNAVVIFRRIAPVASGLGVSMLLLSLLVAVVDFSMLFSLISVLGNALQIHVNEMPWHRCSSRGDGLGCNSFTTCPEVYEEDFYAEDSPFILNHLEIVEDHNAADAWNIRLRAKSFADQCIRSELSAIYKFSQEKRQQYLPYVATQRSVPMLSFLLNKVGLESYGTPTFGFPSASDIFVHFLCWILILAISMQGRSFLLKMCICVTIIFNSIMLTLLVVMLFTRLQGFEEILERYNLGAEVWATAVLVTLNTLRIGQGGLFFIGAQYKFDNNLVVDAVAVIIYLLTAIFLYSTAHLLFRATAAPYLFAGSRQDYISYLRNIEQESLYSQFFVYWTTASELTVYGPFEPFLQLAISCGCTILVLNNIAVVLEAMVSTCVTALDSLSDEASVKAIMRTTIFFVALSSFFLNSRVGFSTAVTIENTVIPAATACVVLLELFVIGVLYGFPRAYANVLAMGTNREEDNLIHRVANLFYLYFWQVSPFLILVSVLLFTLFYGSQAHLAKTFSSLPKRLLYIITNPFQDPEASVLYAFPDPPKSMERTASLGIFLILVPTVIYCFKVFRTYHRIGNIRLLFLPDYVLWGPRMADDRANATRMEKKLQIRKSW